MDFANFTAFDWLVTIFIVLVSLVTLAMGLIKLILWAGSWVGAAFTAYIGYNWALPYTQQWIENETLAKFCTGIGLFILALMVFTVITQIISSFVEDSAFGSIDKVLGLVAGACISISLMAMAYNFVLNQFGDSAPSWIAEAQTPPYLEQALAIIETLEPDEEISSDILNRARKLEDESLDALQNNVNQELNPLKRN